MSFLQEAFNAVIKDSKQANGYFVSLIEDVPFYGGPEEGGWWGSDRHLIAYKHFDTEEQATAAKEAVEKLAKELEDESKKAHGEQCLREMDWLNARGLDADFLPESDGHSTFQVVMSEGLPQESRGCRHYE